jgi:hypothetical protein
MSYTTISIKNKTKKELKDLQLRYNAKSMDELVKTLIVEVKKKKIDDFSQEFQRKLREKNLTLEDIVKSGEKIRGEILKNE